MSETIGYYQIQNGFVFLVLKDFWDQYQMLDDGGLSDEFIPEGFYPLDEVAYEHEFEDDDEARDVLEALGWIETELIED